LEIRALLHEPLRYHPNIVHILGLQWSLSSVIESAFPILVMECSTIGSLKHLQESLEPLDCSTKQKLCYDIARGLTALHSCGIVHGDMKHENVLIFSNKNEKLSKIPYTAKLADFCGSVMDMGPADLRRLDTGTWPFQAPEGSVDLSRDGLKQTDVYSFGLLVWRAFTDGEGFVTLRGGSQKSSDEDKEALRNLKNSDTLTRKATQHLRDYSRTHRVSKSEEDLFIYVILHCVRLRPADRDLIKAQCALRGLRCVQTPHKHLTLLITSLGSIDHFLDLLKQENIEYDAMKARSPPVS
jgi:serine/threonine protein kinase